MKETTIELQLDELLKLEQQLTTFLDEEEYDLFQQQQTVFSDQIKNLLTNNSPETLSTVIEQLKTLETNIATLQNKSAQHFKQLKEKSLLQKRNKSKIKAYK
ncbi:hypothetical protein [Psychromonas sp.]|uniref:hypothetical protein n=1 Tax=Psychromonas sp. TaxID=1884585 RepID=UPI0039E71986